jgi:two-component system cell cycle response regulator DivK
MQILIVEDNPLNLVLFRAVLRKNGHAIIEAEDVANGARSLRPDLDVVLLDIQLPDGSGEDLLALIRARADLRHLPVVAVTANAMRGDRERFLHAGFDHYITKPIDTRTFCGEVEALATRLAGRREHAI